jgi:putative ABC transport system ATP-binding protein
MAWWSRRERRADGGDAAVDPNQPVIRLEAVTKLFKGDANDDTRALDNVTVDIARGEYVSVSGPSGCGKTTFLAVLALLDTPTSGRYWLNGRATDQLTPSERARVRNLDVGLIFQSFNLIGDMTVYENVEYPLTLRGISPADRKARVDAALDRVGLTARARQRPGSLSGGHQQLVAVARAITGRPAILLADEPTGNLDSKTSDEVMQLLRRAVDEFGQSVVMVTHDQQAASYADRRIELVDGRVVRDDAA